MDFRVHAHALDSKDTSSILWVDGRATVTFVGGRGGYPGSGRPGGPNLVVGA